MNAIKRYLPQLIFSFFVGLSILVLYLPTNGLFKNQYDDSYITYRYAVNLASGKGLVFNTYERADSASSFSYTVLLAAFYKGGIKNLEMVGAIIGILSAVGVSYFVYKSIIFLSNSHLIAYLFGYLTGLHGFISGWAISGMETTVFTFLITMFVYYYFFQKNSSRVLHTILLILILLTRMEGVMLVGVWFLREGITQVKLYKKDSWKTFLVQCIVLGMVFSVFYIFKYVYYGTVVSTAVAFKRIATYYLPDPKNVIVVWVGTSMIVSLLATYTLYSKQFKMYGALLLYILLSFISVLIGPHSDGARYSIHLLPICMIFAGCGLIQLFEKRKHLSIGIGILVVVQTLLSTFVVRSAMVRLIADQTCRFEIGNYISSHVSRDAMIVSGDLGMIAYMSPSNEFIDISGLTSKDILTQYQHKDVLDPILMKKKPGILADTFDEIGGKLEHKLLTNQVEHIKNQKIYSNLFTSPQVFTHPMYTCKNGKRTFAVIGITSIYK